MREFRKNGGVPQKKPNKTKMKSKLANRIKVKIPFDESLIKGECFSCGKYIGISAERYSEVGNICPKCNKKCGK